MSHYKTNLRDIKFNLFEAYKTQEYMGADPFADMDEDTARHFLDEIERFAVDEFSASFEDSDRNPPVLEDGEIKLPQSMKDSLNAYYDSGPRSSTVLPPRSHCAGPYRNCSSGPTHLPSCLSAP